MTKHKTSDSLTTSKKTAPLLADLRQLITEAFTDEMIVSALRRQLN